MKYQKSLTVTFADAFRFPFQKYLNPLRSPENSSTVDLSTVDEIFFMVPSILSIHEKFLEELKKRLDSWDPLQRVGDSYYNVVRY